MTGLQLRASSQQTLTPRLQQSVRLLQLSSIDFSQELDNAVVSNPFLEDDEEEEEGEGAPREAGAEPAFAHSGSGSARESSLDDEADWADVSHATPNLHDHLREQLMLARRAGRASELADLVIEAIDEDGYLRHDPAELVVLAASDTPPTEDEMREAIRLVQSFEPTGVAARNLGECLALQLTKLEPSTPGRAVAIALVSEHLNALAARQYAKLQHALRCSEGELRTANALIKQLDPRPGSRHSAAATRYIVPDVLVQKVRDRWIATINPAVMPRIRINQTYAQLFRQARNATQHGSLAQQLQEARWLVRHAEQRFVTIQKVAEVIVQRQRNFFEYGEIGLKPLGIRDVAVELGLHESTISRATGNKYMATPRGIFLFRHFFSRELTTASGGRCSAAAIRALIKEMIAEEKPREPLSDARSRCSWRSRGSRSRDAP